MRHRGPSSPKYNELVVWPISEGEGEGCGARVEVDGLGSRALGPEGGTGREEVDWRERCGVS